MILNSNIDFKITDNDYKIINSDSEILSYPKLFNTTCIKNWCSTFRYSLKGVLKMLDNIFNTRSGCTIHFTDNGRMVVQ